MKMAKASERDIDAAGELMSLLHQLDRGDYPNLVEGAEVPDWFDVDDREHLRAFYDAVMSTLEKAPGYPGRVIGGMCYVIMYDKNEIVDPASDTLDLHPKIVKALAASTDAVIEAREQARNAERYRWLRNDSQFDHRKVPTVFMVDYPERGEWEKVLNGEALDQAIDEARCDKQGAQGGGKPEIDWDSFTPEQRAGFASGGA